MLDRLAEKILAGELAAGDSVRLKVSRDGESFEVEKVALEKIA